MPAARPASQTARPADAELVEEVLAEEERVVKAMDRDGVLEVVEVLVAEELAGVKGVVPPPAREPSADGSAAGRRTVEALEADRVVERLVGGKGPVPPPTREPSTDGNAVGRWTDVVQDAAVREHEEGGLAPAGQYRSWPMVPVGGARGG